MFIQLHIHFSFLIPYSFQLFYTLQDDWNVTKFKRYKRKIFCQFLFNTIGFQIFRTPLCLLPWEWFVVGNVRNKWCSVIFHEIYYSSIEKLSLSHLVPFLCIWNTFFNLLLIFIFTWKKFTKVCTKLRKKRQNETVSYPITLSVSHFMRIKIT